MTPSGRDFSIAGVGAPQKVVHGPGIAGPVSPSYFAAQRQGLQVQGAHLQLFSVCFFVMDDLVGW